MKQEAKDDYDDLVEYHELYMYNNNFFHKQPGVIKLNWPKKQVKTIEPNSPEFHHSATAAEGMSGGPIFRGNVLIGIHTGWDDEAKRGIGLLARFALSKDYRDRVRG